MAQNNACPGDAWRVEFKIATRRRSVKGGGIEEMRCISPQRASRDLRHSRGS